MAGLPTNLKQIANFLQRLPGIGEKTANRLAFYLLRMPEEDLKEFADKVNNLKQRTKLCSNCLNLTENALCDICENPLRDKTSIVVVEDALDVLSFETGNIYNGLYHVLHGKIDPLNNVGPDDIYIDKLLERAETASAKASAVKEIILATNLDTEGEATAMYIKNKLLEVNKRKGKKFKITRLAYGLPIGASLEYADYMTLRKSIEGRNEY